MNEENLISRYKNGDMAAGAALIFLNEPLVQTMFRRHYASNINSKDDYLQEGRIGLLEACKRYDASKKDQFKYYKSIWVRKRMNMLFKKEYKFEKRRSAEIGEELLTINASAPAIQGARHDIEFLLDFNNVSDILPKRDHDNLINAALQYKTTRDEGIYKQIKSCC